MQHSICFRCVETLSDPNIFSSEIKKGWSTYFHRSWTIDTTIVPRLMWGYSIELIYSGPAFQKETNRYRQHSIPTYGPENSVLNGYRTSGKLSQTRSSITSVTNNSLHTFRYFMSLTINCRHAPLHLTESKAFAKEQYHQSWKHSKESTWPCFNWARVIGMESIAVLLYYFKPWLAWYKIALLLSSAGLHLSWRQRAVHLSKLLVLPRVALLSIISPLKWKTFSSKICSGTKTWCMLVCFISKLDNLF